MWVVWTRIAVMVYVLSMRGIEMRWDEVHRSRRESTMMLRSIVTKPVYESVRDASIHAS